MKVYANQQTWEIPFTTKERTLEELNRIFARLFQDNQIVQVVVVDGQVWTEGYNEELAARLEQIQEVHIQTIDGDVLCRNIMLDLKNYIPKLIRAFDSISDLLYGEMSQEEWSFVAQLNNGINWVLESTQVLENHYSRTGTDRALSSALGNFHMNIKGILADLEGAYQSSNLVHAGDLIKYELPELFKPLLTNLEARVNA